MHLIVLVIILDYYYNDYHGEQGERAGRAAAEEDAAENPTRKVRSAECGSTLT